MTTVAENADPVSDLEDLFHAVVDEQDRDAAAPQLSDDCEEPLHLTARERCRWLVHDQHSRLERQRFGDLHQLLIRDREPTHRNADALLDAQGCE